MKKLAFGFVALFAALVIAACGSDSDSNGNPDAGGDTGPTPTTDGTTPTPDTVGSPEGVVLPDVGPLPDGTTPPPPDGATTPTCDEAVLGKACTEKGGECGESATCLATTATGGICTCQCTPDDPQTQLSNEDSCPGGGKAICGRVPLNNGQTLNLCFVRCQPTLGSNTCEPGFACSPRTEQYGGFESAVCLFAGCETDDDCGITVTNGDASGVKTCTCDGDFGDDGVCAATKADMGCGTGEKCVVAWDVKNPLGLCVAPGKCDTASGLCGAHATDKADAKVGDPCNSDKDCGEYQDCSVELDIKTLFGAKDHGAACTADEECCGQSCSQAGTCEGLCRVNARNGYCTIRGCKYATTTAYSEFACPAGSTCFGLFAGGVCQKSCDPADAATCRGNAADKYGDYECRDWSGFQGIAGTPTCETGGNIPCNVPPLLGITCAELGGQGNPNNMACRDPDTGTEKTDPADPTGYCLDDTTSGDKVTP